MHCPAIVRNAFAKQFESVIVKMPGTIILQFPAFYKTPIVYL